MADRRDRDRVPPRAGQGRPAPDEVQPSASPERPAPPASSAKRLARFRQTFEHAPIGLAHITPEGCWLEVNQFLLDFLGYSRAELQRMTYRDFTHPDHLQEDEAGRQRLLAGEIPIHRMEKCYIRKDGAVVWGLLTVSLVRTAAGEPDYLIGAVEDIGDRKRAEARLREVTALLEEAEQTAHIGAWAWDVANDTVTWTDEVFRLYALEPTAGPLTFDQFLVRVHPDDSEQMRRAVLQALRDRSTFTVEHRVVWPDGRVRTIHCQGRVVTGPTATAPRMLGSVQDITERKQAAARLEESEQRYRSLFDRHPDAVFSIDLAGHFQSANSACEAVSGYRPEELVGQHFAPLVVPEHRDRTVGYFQAAAAGAAQSYEVAIRHKNGRRIEIGVTNVPILVRGAVVGVFGVAKDLTAQRSLEAQLQQAQKLEAVGQLAGGIAHDFNNLLAAILANSELVLAEVADEPVRQEVEVIRQTAERATALTRQLLAFSRNQVVQPRLVDLNAVVQDTDPMLRRVLGERISLVTDLRPVGSVLADRGQLEQVLLNLAVNARDAMPLGGTLTIRTRDIAVDDTLAQQHEGLRTGGHVALTVEDTGTGIPPDLHARIFEPFFSTKSVGHGSGLGLAMVYGLVKQWGGEVTLESAPGMGATFTVYLPRQQGTAVPRSAQAKREVQRGTETVLVVEDEAGVRNAIRRILAGHGYTVLEAQNGVEALRVIDETTRPIDLVITDLAMPEMDGRELLGQLRGRGAPFKVLVMSGYDAQAAMRGEALPPNAHFLEKPFTVEGLLRKVRSTLEASAAPSAE
jgi:PAS domain S-box-containing protein